MFIYSLPLIFGYSDFGSPLELLLILITLFVCLYLSAPLPEPLFEYKKLKPPMLYHHFLYSWTGQLSLKRVFWGFFIAFNLSIVFADYAVKIGLFSIASWMSAHFIFFFPSIFWTIAIWRSSGNTMSKLWAAYARLATLLVFVEYAAKIYIYRELSQEFFDCEQHALEYLICLQ